MTAKIIPLHRRCPPCMGRGQLVMTAVTPPLKAPCLVCKGLGIVTARTAADWYRANTPAKSRAKP